MPSKRLLIRQQNESARQESNASALLRRFERDCLKVAAAQVGLQCGFVEVGSSRSQIRPGWASRVPGASITEHAPAESVRIYTGWERNPEFKPAVYTVCDNRDALLNTVNP